jgi:hypothetical protein
LVLRGGERYRGVIVDSWLIANRDSDAPGADQDYDQRLIVEIDRHGRVHAGDLPGTMRRPWRHMSRSRS